MDILQRISPTIRKNVPINLSRALNDLFQLPSYLFKFDINLFTLLN